jgi:hypothetical protein
LIPASYTPSQLDTHAHAPSPLALDTASAIAPHTARAQQTPTKHAKAAHFCSLPTRTLLIFASVYRYVAFRSNSQAC